MVGPGLLSQTLLDKEAMKHSCSGSFLCLIWETNKEIWLHLPPSSHQPCFFAAWRAAHALCPTGLGTPSQQEPYRRLSVGSLFVSPVYQEAQAILLFAS